MSAALKMLRPDEVCARLGVTPLKLRAMVDSSPANDPAPRVDLGSGSRACWRWREDRVDAWAERYSYRVPRNYIYVIRCSALASFKIGTAKVPARRLEELQVGCPHRLAIVHFEEGNRSREFAIHKRLSEHRMVGEWFASTDETETLLREMFPRMGT